MSQAGSPTPRPPKSMTADSRPYRVSRFAGCRSAWSQTGGPSHPGAARALRHTAVATSASIVPFVPSASIASRTSASRAAIGPPRNDGGPSVASNRRSAATNRPSRAAASARSAIGPATASSPASQRYTDHARANPSSGTPLASGTGIASGSARHSRGSHRCSLCTSSTAPGTRGRRTASPSPSRKIALSVPAERTRVMGRPAHCGNWFAINRPTSGPSMSGLSLTLTRPCCHQRAHSMNVLS